MGTRCDTVTALRGRSSRLHPASERGAALVAVLLLSSVMIVAAVMFSLGTGTELKIAHNDVLGRQALGVAEAGISHAMKVVAASGADELGMDEELTDPPTGGLAGFATVVAVVEDGVSYNYRCANLTGSIAGSYCLRAYDNFDESVGSDNPLDDIDDSILLRSRGTVGTATRIVEALVGLSTGGPGCAVMTHGNLQMSGAPLITGSSGCAHTNATLTISGNPNIEQGATASSTMTISGDPTMEGVALTTNELKDTYEADNDAAPPMFIPSVRPMSFGTAGLELHDYVMNHPQGFRLDADTNIYVGPGYTGPGGPGSAWICVENPPDCTGGRVLTGAEVTAAGLDTFKHESQGWIPAAQWISDKDWAVPGVYFVEGSVVISKDWGDLGSPWRATIIALNSIQVPGKPIMAPYHQTTDPSAPGYVTTASPAVEWALRNVLLMSGNDIEINGDAGQDNYAGGMLAHQQIKVNGNPDITGFLVAEDGATTWAGDPAPNCNSDRNLYCDPFGNAIASGNPKIHFDGLGTSLFPPLVKRLTWNEIR